MSTRKLLVFLFLLGFSHLAVAEDIKVFGLELDQKWEQAKFSLDSQYTIKPVKAGSLYRVITKHDNEAGTIVLTDGRISRLTFEAIFHPVQRNGKRWLLFGQEKEEVRNELRAYEVFDRGTYLEANLKDGKKLELRFTENPLFLLDSGTLERSR